MNTHGHGNPVDNFTNEEEITRQSLQDDGNMGLLVILAAISLLIGVVCLSRHRRRQFRLLRHGIQCTICQFNIETPAQLHETPCGHSFHAECLQKWMNRTLTCPICRRRLNQLNENEEILHVANL